MEFQEWKGKGKGKGRGAGVTDFPKRVAVGAIYAWEMSGID